MVADPTAFCILQEPSKRAIATNADTKCTYCHDQRARCYKCPSALQPEIWKLQQCADDYNTWQHCQDALPPALRSTWVLPANPAPKCPANAPKVYGDLHEAQAVVKLGILQAQRAIPGWNRMSEIQKNTLLKLDPVVRNGGDHGYWW
ncbi:hypothetical protein EAF04_008234 [Stromatinia cepivora]|nr:hypothetical protein EAF04_008234 [Stromatinia cepivora]